MASQQHQDSEYYFEKRILVLGCGNILFGDDGFGPAVADYLINNAVLPQDILVINAETSVRNILFDLILVEDKPEKIVVVDAVDFEKEPGEIIEISIDEMPYVKTDDFSMHQAPSSNLLKELQDHTGVAVDVIVVQVAIIPDEVAPGLSEQVQRAVPVVAHQIIEIHLKLNPLEIFKSHQNSSSNSSTSTTKESDNPSILPVKNH